MGFGTVILLELFVEKLMGHSVGHRPILLVGIFSFLVGLILISIGLCAELIVRTYYESTGKKIYTTKPNP